MRTLVIGNKNYSSWSLRPWLLMRHFGLEFREVMLPLDTPEFFQRVLDYSPSGRVPALRVDDETIWDSLAICETVNERWLDGRAWPAAARARAAARSAACEMHSGFAAMRSQLPMNCRRQPREPHWDAAAERDIGRVQQLWQQLRAAHGGGADFLCGDFGIVDAMFAPVCVRFKGYGPPLLDSTRAYMDRIFALPAMAEWLADAQAEAARVAADEA
ncbi:MAG: glutathione S-transferase family protein [Frankiaceae bacterium]|nr:glutathione S-transferase family protein [Arenimonas sp.]